MSRYSHTLFTSRDNHTLVMSRYPHTGRNDASMIGLCIMLKAPVRLTVIYEEVFHCVMCMDGLIIALLCRLGTQREKKASEKGIRG